MGMTVNEEPQSSIVLYQTEDGQTRIQCRFEGDTIWLTQKLMAELFKKDVRTVNEHIQNVISEGELAGESVIRKFRITAADGKGYETQHYNLEMIIAVGYRVKSPRGTQFRQWATARLMEAIAAGRDRILLTLATGTGKTFIAFQIAWKLFHSRWNLGREPTRRPRILFLADRNILANQAYNAFSAFPEDALVRIEPGDIRKKGKVPKNGRGCFSTLCCRSM